MINIIIWIIVNISLVMRDCVNRSINDIHSYCFCIVGFLVSTEARFCFE